MAQTESRIRLVFDGVERGVAAAAKKAELAVKGLDDQNSKLSKSSDAAGKGLLTVGKGMAAIAAAGGGVNAIGGVVGAVTALSGAALLIPGAALAGAAAMQTFKLATAGFGEAIGAGLSGDMEKFAEATKDMAPAMQEAARAAVAFKPQIDDLKKTVQGNFWAGFSKEITQLGNNYLPILKTGMGDIATQLGAVAKGAIAAANTPFFKGAVTSILQSTAGFFREVGTGAGDVATGIVGIGKVGATYLPQLGEAIGGVAKRFGDWAKSIEGQNQIRTWIDTGIAAFQDLGKIAGNIGSAIGSIFKGLGTDMSSPLAQIETLTGKVAEFLKSVEGQDALKALGETLRVVGEQVGRVLDAGLKELGPIMVALAPTVQEVARTLGDLLVGAIETVGPMIKGVADFLRDYPGVVGPATIVVAGFVVAVKGLQIASSVAGWLSGIGGSIDDIGKKAGTAGGSVDGFKGKLGLLKGVAAGLALGAVAVAMNEINESAKGENLAGWDENLQDIAGAAQQIASLDIGGIFSDLNGELTTWKQNLQTGFNTDGSSNIGKFFGWLKQQLNEPMPPIKIDADTTVAKGQVDTFVGDVNSRAPMVEINGNTNGAGFALREILAEIAAGKGTVEINGQSMPAQDALKYVQGLIDNSVGIVDINGNKVPAGQALAQVLQEITGSRPVVPIDGNASQVSTALRSAITSWNGYTINVNAVVSSRIGGLADGGLVSGPGTGTSDTAGLFALSDGEYVATAKQVQNAGGAASFARIMAALDRGAVPGLAGGGPVSRNGIPWGSVSQKKWDELMRAGWKGDPNDGMEALYPPDDDGDDRWGRRGRHDRHRHRRGRHWRHAMRHRGPRVDNSGEAMKVALHFSGNTDSAMATAIQGMIRTGKIQVR